MQLEPTPNGERTLVTELHLITVVEYWKKALLMISCIVIF